MSKVISIFNNKGGVGKTTYMYHVAHLLAEGGERVLMVDCDSQCNLTAYSLSDTEIQKSWSANGNSIWRNVEPVSEGLGDIRNRSPSKALNARGELFIVPGDLRLNEFEDRLGDTWNAAKGGSAQAVRTQSAIHRYIRWAAAKVEATLVLVDLGPNLGALNRAVLAASDYFITPVAPDLFSIQGAENLGRKLLVWRSEWNQINAAWHNQDVEVPSGKPTYLGYVVQQHNIRDNARGMTAGWAIYGDDLIPAIMHHIVNPLGKIGQVVKWEDDDYNLGQIPNLHSLIPYSMNARKPIFYCRSADGLKGAHIRRARESADHFDGIVATLEAVIDPAF